VHSECGYRLYVGVVAASGGPGVSGRPRPLRIAFLGCGFLCGVHSRHLRFLGETWRPSYASRDAGRAERFRQRFGGDTAYAGYAAALEDPDIDAVVVALPPRWHVDWTLAAIDAGKHVLVEKPAFLSGAEYETARAARDTAGVAVLVGENDHYKPLAVTLRRLLADNAIGELLMASFTTVANKPKPASDWRNDAELAGGDAFFEEGVHWLHFAGSLGPRIVRASGHRPSVGGGATGPDRRTRSQLVSFDYDMGAVGALFYSREVPSLLRGAGLSQLYGQRGVIAFESNGGTVVVHNRVVPRIVHPGWRDIRGYRAMYLDFAAAIRSGRQPEMNLERALDDHRLMELVVSG
jgi:predicted dehydrogenase